MRGRALEYYKDYWVGAEEERSKRAYYQRLYHNIRSRIVVPEGSKVLDVAGGDGQLLEYLGLQKADILDISQSGLKLAAAKGFTTVFGDVENEFPIAGQSYDAAFLFEVLEHLHFPHKTLFQTHRVLKPGGILYVGQPNMKADGVHHVRRYYLKPLLKDLRDAGFSIEWVDYVPAYSMRDSILSDIRKNPSWVRKIIQCVNLVLSFLPWRARYQMAKWIPDRFALIFVVKAVKRTAQ
jgi:SAM-dependent methyltransferase